MEDQRKISDEVIMDQIYYIRGEKVMFDSDLAELYGVETKHLKRQVRRNMERFPSDFMFELTPNEFPRSQIGTLESGKNLKYAPMVFTENGVSMLSSVLNSKNAINVNIQIMRIFNRVRKMLLDNTELRLEIEKIKSKLDNQDKNMEIVFQYLDELLQQKNNTIERTPIGFKPKGF